MQKKSRLCGYEGRIDHVNAHIKKCKQYSIISQKNEQILKLEEKWESNLIKKLLIMSFRNLKCHL